jgi:hypothetical protein
MPRADRTGPEGMGPMTGRQAGYCAGYDGPGFANPLPGRGYGMGRGRGGFGERGYGRGSGGRGWRHRFYATGRPFWAHYDYGPAWGYPAPLTPEQELDGLKHEAEWLKSQLETIGQRIEELEGK